MSIRYRIGQFWRMLTAGPLSPAAYEKIGAVLTENEKVLFRQLAPRDQWHGYRVLQTLEKAEYTQPNLQAAALLHDIGKSKVALSIWERSLIVMAQALIPRRATKWGQGEPRGWTRSFVVKEQHAAWGAAMARDAGSAPLTVTLIGRHQAKVSEGDKSNEARLLRILQWADNLN